MKSRQIKFMIEDVLKQKNISKEELCREMHISRETFDKYCTGNVRYLDTTFLKKVCYYLQCDIKDIIHYIG